MSEGNEKNGEIVGTGDVLCEVGLAYQQQD